MGSKPPGCIFCEKPHEDRDRENYILARGIESFVLLNAYPYGNGHLMVVPYAHLATLEDLPTSTLTELMELTRTSIASLRRVMAPDGFNVGMNIGHAAGAGIADHVHLHVVPRWNGDTNFMPVLAETRLIPEMLTSTYDKLIDAGIARVADSS
ncbi:MAG TPA: HIT domain-containing protein [Chloroflexota bacterium]|nr:HIT domain-containing protein [Chloroflexota bacterium]